jgi:antitoxin ParD1/3/4
MATMNISLPDALKDWVEQQVATGRYANASDMVRDLVRHDMDERERAIAELRALIQEGLNSGASDVTLEDLRKSARAKSAAARRSNAA